MPKRKPSVKPDPSPPMGDGAPLPPRLPQEPPAGARQADAPAPAKPPEPPVSRDPPGSSPPATGERPVGLPGPFPEWWGLDPTVTFLNHGSFGACPTAIGERQRAWRAELEAEPVRFFDDRLPGLLAEARAVVGSFVGAHPDDLAFVTNATTGVNTVLRSLSFAPGDELVMTDHEYNACRNALVFAAERAGATVRIAAVPWPCPGPEAVFDAVLAAVTPRTRLVLLDHLTSPSALLFPLSELIAELQTRRGIDVLVDGAHGPGAVPLTLDALGAAYYTGNLHKWACGPKGAAFLHVRRDRQTVIRPLVISHGFNAPVGPRTRFRNEFDWNGTADPTPWLGAAATLTWLGERIPGGWPAIIERNRRLAVIARRRLLARTGLPAPCPESMLGPMAAVILPPGHGDPPLPGRDPLQQRLFAEHRIEVPVMPCPAWPRRNLRFAIQLYNDLPQIDRLADALAKLLGVQGGVDAAQGQPSL